MAAIIAQMSRANRERKKRKAEQTRLGIKTVGTDKCVYQLLPFDRCYDPLKHNKYMKVKVQVDRRNLVINTAKCKYILCLERKCCFFLL